MDVATAIDSFSWYFPQCHALTRLSKSARQLTDAELDRVDAATRDHAWLRDDLLSKLAPAAASAWRRCRADALGAAALFDAALALVARTSLPRWSILWPEYEALISPCSKVGPLSWVTEDPALALGRS